MRLLTVSFALGLLLVPAVSAAPARAVVFNDGTVHVIDANNSFPFEDVEVEGTTTVVVVPGGQIGGEVFSGRLIARDDAVINISGGSIRAGVELTDSAQGDISGGSIDGPVQSSSQSELIITGGALIQVNALGPVTIAGGVIGGPNEGGGTFSQSGGRLRVLGGTLRGGQIAAIGSGEIEVVGGNLPNRIEALDASVITLFGTSFNFPPGDIAALSGSLTGFLQDGTPVDSDLGRASTEKITLVATQIIDSDNDGVGDGVDNCPGDPNPGQEDRDFDGIGDVCDPFPDDPTNDPLNQCELDLAQALDDLAVCESTSGFQDADGDGEHDATDLCPATPSGEVVDQEGCSRSEFCTSFPAVKIGEKQTCKKADWMNDEPRLSPWRKENDCDIDKNGTPGRGIDDTCVVSVYAP